MKKHIIYAILSGILLALGWPSFGFPLLLFVGFAPLIIAEHQISQRPVKKKNRKIFGLASLTFFIWNAIVIWWLHYAKEFNENGELYNSWTAYLVPVIANTLLMSLVFMLYRYVKNKAGNLYGMLFLPAIWTAFERFHLTWEMTWPWFNLGNGFAAYYKWVQWYEYTGTFGGTLWILIVNLIVFYYFTAYRNTKEKKFLYKLIAYPLLWIIIPIGISYIIYFNYEDKGETLKAIAVQPEHDPYLEKYNKSSEEILDEILYLADTKITADTDFVVGPETAIPGAGPGFIIQRINEDYLLEKIKTWTEQHPNTTWVTGAELMDIYPSEKYATPTARPYRNSLWWYDRYNSAVQINNSDTIDYYHKSKLVVGVEHFPYMSVLKPLLGDLMLNFGGTVSTLGINEEAEVLRNSKNRAVIAPLICYESIFGDYTTEFIRKGANVIFIMTNDSWWENTDGHRQLLLYGNLRAIENRRSIVRSANSGVSAFINQRGDIITQLDYGKHGALSGEVKMNEELTFYSQYGDYLARVGILLSGILLAYTFAQYILEKKKKTMVKKK